MLSRLFSFVLITLGLVALNTYSMDQNQGQSKKRTIEDVEDAKDKVQDTDVKRKKFKKSNLKAYCLQCAQTKLCIGHQMLWESTRVCEFLQRAGATTDNYSELLLQAKAVEQNDDVAML